MKKDEIIQALRAHREELEKYGVVEAALFGSVARGEESPDSDIDVLVAFRPDMQEHGLKYFTQLDNLKNRLSLLLGRPADVVSSPVRKPRLKAEIERDRVDAF